MTLKFKYEKPKAAPILREERTVWRFDTRYDRVKYLTPEGELVFTKFELVRPVRIARPHKHKIIRRDFLKQVAAAVWVVIAWLFGGGSRN